MRKNITPVLFWWAMWYTAFPLGLALASAVPHDLAHVAVTLLLRPARSPGGTLAETASRSSAIFLNNVLIFALWTVGVGVWHGGLTVWSTISLLFSCGFTLVNGEPRTIRKLAGTATVSWMTLNWVAIFVSGLWVGRTTKLAHALIWSLPHGAFELLAYALLAATATMKPDHVDQRLRGRFWIGVFLLAVSALTETLAGRV